MVETQKEHDQAPEKSVLIEIFEVQKRITEGTRNYLKKLSFNNKEDAMEIVNFVQDLEAQYEPRMDTLKRFGLMEGAEIPSCNEVMSGFSIEELKVANLFDKPMLLLIPETSFNTKIQAIKNFAPRQNSIHVDSEFTDSDSDSHEITGWKSVIVDGTQEVENYLDENSKAALGERVEKHKLDRKPGEKGMTRDVYALLIMEFLKENNAIDQDGCTILDDDTALTDSLVPVAGMYNGQFNFDLNEADVDANYARFRTVMGK